jgi:hypothetical protein
MSRHRLIRGRCNLKRSQKTVIFLSVYKISSLKITLPKTLQLKTLDFLQQTITMNENVQWQMIKDSVLFALSSGFSVSLFHFYLKKKSTRGVHIVLYFFFFSHCIDPFICYSRIVYIGDSLGHVICLLIYFRLAAIV